MGSNPTLSAKRVYLKRGIAITLVIGAVFVLSPKARAACDPNYVVKRGDSWWSIAQSEGVTLRALLKVNDARKSTLIQPKQRICVPQPRSAEVAHYTPDEVIQIIREVWPDELEDRAIAIARRESKLRPGAIGIPNNCCYGLFQIYYKWHKGWLPEIGVTRARQLLDPRLNARAALRIYERNNGWGPWE